MRPDRPSAKSDGGFWTRSRILAFVADKSAELAKFAQTLRFDRVMVKARNRVRFDNKKTWTHLGMP